MSLAAQGAHYIPPMCDATPFGVVRPAATANQPLKTDSHVAGP